MKKRNIATMVVVISFVVLLAFYSSPGESLSANESNEEKPANTDSKFDPAKAKKYGADQYGMKKYVMAFLKRGPNRDLPAEKRKELQAAHLKNIVRMVEEGTLVLAGPFMDNGDIRGIYIFNVQSVEEARKLTNTDPAIQAGSLVMELKPWYGTAALVELREIHKTIQEKGIMD
jgi:uncharacterized protein YciI